MKTEKSKRLDYSFAKFSLQKRESPIEGSIYEDKLLFSWEGYFVKATISPYYIPAYPPSEHAEDNYSVEDLSKNPIIKRKVIDPLIHMIALEIDCVRSFEELKKLADQKIIHQDFSYSRELTDEPPPNNKVFRVHDQTHNKTDLFRKLLQYKGVSKSIVPGNEDLVDIAENLEIFQGMSIAHVTGATLKEATERALEIYNLRGRLKA